ncbi:Alpha/Beta hydrolase protein [Lophiotrema nucula]|uniref:Alpha/Beta hydrolase protein n=1 Tax=Lophiotrema nucula TaxID=690887 RepID=A0A6A5ZBT1_9PLEO|nr:Alpha/Beta hydrolase protein [Lophiotrema nucula]
MATYQNASTQYLTNPHLPSTVYAYRLLGPLSSPKTPDNEPPLLFLPHFRGTMDLIDPLLINSLARTRRVLLIDYGGVGKSRGEVARTAGGVAAQILSFLRLADFHVVDLLGFSVGSRIAQLVALNAEASGTGVRVRKLIVAGGTANPTPSNGIVGPSPERDELVPKLAAAPMLPFESFHTLFFSPDEVGRKACLKWWARLKERNEQTSGEKISPWVDEGYTSWDDAKAIHAQASQLSTFDTADTSVGNEGSFDRLKEWEGPVLVANGSDDFMVPTINSFTTAQQLKKGKLIIYPNSGHGFLYQYAEEFAADVEYFLTHAE